MVPSGELAPGFWRQLRGEFLIPEEEAFFNTGTLGASPRVVLQAVIDHMTHVDRDIAHWDYHPEHEQFLTGYSGENWLREKLALLINATERSELALTPSATVGMRISALNGSSDASSNWPTGCAAAWPGFPESRSPRHRARDLFRRQRCGGSRGWTARFSRRSCGDAPGCGFAVKAPWGSVSVATSIIWKRTSTALSRWRRLSPGSRRSSRRPEVQPHGMP